MAELIFLPTVHMGVVMCELNAYVPLKFLWYWEVEGTDSAMDDTMQYKVILLVHIWLRFFYALHKWVYYMIPKNPDAQLASRRIQAVSQVGDKGTFSKLDILGD